jgi:hypothetical protein
MQATVGEGGGGSGIWHTPYAPTGFLQKAINLKHKEENIPNINAKN